MTRTLTLILTILLFASVAAWAADNAAVVGTWDVVGTDDSGQAANWTLIVKDDGGKLGGDVERRSGRVPNCGRQTGWRARLRSRLW